MYTYMRVKPMARGSSIPAADREFSDVPYAGLFGDTVIARVVEEIIADPHSIYHMKDLEDLTGKSTPRIREALLTLTRFGLLESHGGKHPSYTVDRSKKTFVALTLLAYATLDDTKGSDCMNTATRHYCETILPVCREDQAIASASSFKITGTNTGLSPVIAVGNGNVYHYTAGVVARE
jgi:hypothetical protein